MVSYMQGITKITHSRNKHLLLVCKFLKFESFECQNLVLSQINFTSLIGDSEDLANCAYVL